MYRVRKRMKAGTITVAEGVTLKTAYETIIADAKDTPKQYMIDEITYTPFSVLTVREAKKRLERGEV